MSSLAKKKEIVNNVMPMILEGHTYHDACESVGVTYLEFVDWVTNLNACKSIKVDYEKQIQLLVEHALYRAAIGFVYEETNITKRGKQDPDSNKITYDDTIVEKTITKQSPPNVKALTSYLVHTDPEKWADNDSDLDMANALESIRQEMLNATTENDLMEDAPVFFEEKQPKSEKKHV